MKFKHLVIGVINILHENHYQFNVLPQNHYQITILH